MIYRSFCSFLVTLKGIVLIGVLCPVNVWGVEVLENDSGDGYLLKGESFGPSPGVVLHDDFEDGSVGGPLSGKWSISSSGGDVPVYSDEDYISGAQAGKALFRGSNYNSTAEFKEIGGLRNLYLSYYVKVIRESGDASRNIKLARLTAGYDGGYEQPSSGVTLFGHQGNGIVYQGIGEGYDLVTDWIGGHADSEWHRVEHVLKLSAPAGAANGSAVVRIDGAIKQDLSGLVTEHYGNSFEWLTMPYYVAHDPGGDYTMFYDNVQVSKSPARVELCLSSEYENCQRPIVGEVVSWADNEIVINAASVPSSDYRFYVFDSNGDLLNESGAEICSRCPEATEVMVE